MDVAYVYLKFPEYTEFLKYIGKHGLNQEIGIIVWDLRPRFDSILYFVRLTKALEIPKVILLCDVKIYSGFISSKTPEELTGFKNAKIEEIKKAAKKILGEELSIVDAEYQLEPITK